MPILTIAGAMLDTGFQQARELAEALAKESKDMKLVIEEIQEIPWKARLEKLKKGKGGKAHENNSGCFVTHSVEGYIGEATDFLVWVKTRYDKEPTIDSKTAATVANERFSAYRKASGNEFCFFDIKFGDGKTAKMVFEVNTRICPKTSKNFVQLCTGEVKEKGADGSKLHYKGTPFHRIVPGGWAQGGDIKSGAGTGGCSVYGKTFGDESFTIKHDRRGILGMANKGPHTNGSQFYITFKPLPFLDQSKVAFGWIIDGSEALAKLEECSTKNQRPTPDIVIVDCGTL
uniref:Peptidyl-prolyl cis-trans isomerase n=1 Tax=Lotharella globosa TaxID=91324 RepID=A0A7S4DSW7_9EUKA|mmetsp:Transcript_15296/g.31016  ORF Transcript_15296/g.31016 Transcript_15296/m.31016 type:complete len:288 (-) Transcript_15296:615-1478(-)